MEKDMKFTTAGEYHQDFRWVLGPHGTRKDMARWVIEQYGDRDDYLDNRTVQMWIAASEQILEDPESEERSSLYVGPGE